VLSGLLGRVFGPLKHDKFLRATGALVGGTAAAQGLGLLALPLLTRFYRPEDFSVLAGYVAILTMASTVAGMRFDTAIPLPEDDDTAKNLLTLALTSIAAIVIIAVLLIYFTGPFLAQAMGRPEIEPYLWLVPFGIGLTAVYTAFQYMATRSKAFPLIARTKLTQAFTGLCAQIGLGWMGVAPLGLLLGHALMSGAGVVALARKSRRGGDYAATVSRQSLWRTAKTYRRFPQYSVAEELANNAGIQLPILLITAMLVGPEGGLLFLAMRAIGMPLSIVGNAVAQVYYSEAAQYARTGTLARETSSVFKRLSRLLVLPMLAV
jgi:O-antigen/teichoic acid export membrane protein